MEICDCRAATADNHPTDGPDGMNHMPSLQIATGCDDGIANWTAIDLPAFLVYLRPTFGVNGSVGAGTFVEPPMSGGDHRIRILLGNIAGHQTQDRFSNSRFSRHVVLDTKTTRGFTRLWWRGQPQSRVWGRAVRPSALRVSAPEDRYTSSNRLSLKGRRRF
jgi:hypothetical protein